MFRNILSLNLRQNLWRLNTRMSSTNYDLVVIGSGPGGYVAAIKAAQLGLKTACVEKDSTFGGTCLNVGCIPSKALLHSSHVFKQASDNEFKSIGIDVSNVKLNLEQLMANKFSVVKQLTEGVAYLFKKNKINGYKGIGRVKNSRQVVVKNEDQSETVLNTKNILIASGSTSASLPGVETDEKYILSSTGALSLERIPENMIVIGGGVIGLELGSVWSRLGSKVTVVEFMGGIGGTDIDFEVGGALKSILSKQGMRFLLNKKVLSVKKRTESILEVITTTTKGTPVTEEMLCDALLVSVGRKPFTSGLGLEEAGILLDERGRVKVGNHYETSLKGVYAIGDCISGPMLAHKAEDEGMACVEWIANQTETHIDYNAIPSVIYTHPEVAWVGQSEQAVKETGKAYKVGTFPMKANSRARTCGESEGLVKVLADKETDRLLGVHIISSVAGELINEAAVAVEYGASAEDIARTCHAHPTVAEALREACHMAAFGKPINF